METSQEAPVGVQMIVVSTKAVSQKQDFRAQKVLNSHSIKLFLHKERSCSRFHGQCQKENCSLGHPGQSYHN